MTKERLLATTTAINVLTSRLMSYECVRRNDLPADPDGPQIAFSLGELEASFRRFLDQLLPDLLHPGLSEKEGCDLLFDIALELQHVNYHLHASRYLRELVADYRIEELKQEEAKGIAALKPQPSKE